MNYSDFIKPELLVLVPVLIFVGKICKDSVKISSSAIPILLGATGMALSALWVAATSSFDSPQRIFMAVFTSIVQGLLCAAAAVYGHQIWKQGKKRKDEHRTNL